MVGQTKRLIYGKIYSQRFTTSWTVRRSNPDGGEVSALVLAGPGVHPASYTVGTGTKRGSGHGFNRPPDLAPSLSIAHSILSTRLLIPMHVKCNIP